MPLALGGRREGNMLIFKWKGGIYKHSKSGFRMFLLRCYFSCFSSLGSDYGSGCLAEVEKFNLQKVDMS